MWIGCGMRTLGVSDTGGAAVVGLGFGQDPVAGGVDHLHAFSGHHVVHHVSAGRQTWSHGLSFNVRYHILVPYRGFAVLGLPLPSSLSTAGMHMPILAQILPKIVTIGTYKLVGILVVHSLTWWSRGFFGVSGVKAVRGDGGAKDLVLGDESQHSSLGQ